MKPPMVSTRIGLSLLALVVAAVTALLLVLSTPPSIAAPENGGQTPAGEPEDVVPSEELPADSAVAFPIDI